MIENQNGRNLAAVARELAQELKDFVRTRAQIFVSEMQEKVGAWGTGAAMFALAGAFLGTASGWTVVGTRGRSRHPSLAFQPVPVPGGMMVAVTRIND